MTKYFTADTHFGHEGIIEMSGRKFGSIGEHDDYLIDGINRIVGKNDELYLLGDFAWHGAESYAERIICRHKHLIWGNHDRNNFKRAFKTVVDVCEIKLRGIKAWLSHYPHAIWPSSHYGSMHFYGHLHREQEAAFDKIWPQRRSMDVGVDSAKLLLGDYIPFSEDYLYVRLTDRQGHDPVEFYYSHQWVRNLSEGIFKSRADALNWAEAKKLTYEMISGFTGVQDCATRLEYLPGDCFHNFRENLATK